MLPGWVSLRPVGSPIPEADSRPGQQDSQTGHVGLGQAHVQKKMGQMGTGQAKCREPRRVGGLNTITVGFAASNPLWIELGKVGICTPVSRYVHKHALPD